MTRSSEPAHLHERLVIVADLLNVNVEFGVDVRLQSAITLRVTGGATQQASRILQLTLVVQPSCGSASVTMTRLEDARELLPIELECTKQRWEYY